jgi:TolB-like protein
VNPTKFLTELKRRNVYRAAVAYGVVAWFLTQLTTQVFPFFEIPNSAVRFVVIALAVGFPVAMLLAWVYEFTPEGVVRTEDLDPVRARSAQRATGRILDFIIIGVLLLVIAMLIVGRRPFYGQMGESISQKSIAVLPFENLSEDKANAYFAEGIQDEIMTRLSKIADLKVISRTSTQRYKGVSHNLRDIAQQLGVSNVLEGSVQKAADQVRISVQLVNTINDSHIWAETYDRKLIDVFAVESDVAQKIAASLEAKLTGREKRDIAVVATRNPQAYDAFLHALALKNKEGVEDVKNIIGFSRRAVELDPNYAEAWAILGIFEAQRYFIPDHSEAQLTRARMAAETALRLAPDMADAHIAMGMFYYYCLQDFDRALAELEDCAC